MRIPYSHFLVFHMLGISMKDTLVITSLNVYKQVDWFHTQPIGHSRQLAICPTLLWAARDVCFGCLHAPPQKQYAEAIICMIHEGALGAVLSWESNLPSDLVQFFGNCVVIAFVFKAGLDHMFHLVWGSLYFITEIGLITSNILGCVLSLRLTARFESSACAWDFMDLGIEGVSERQPSCQVENEKTLLP